ncbi:MAG: hypothetical protein AB7O96_04785 [Pseudobdellovibrionaceae bacterium]
MAKKLIGNNATVSQNAVFLRDLQVLVDELTKNEPNKAKIKKLMIACGLPYSTDPIHQLSTVLNSVSISPRTNRDIEA